jgi:hypothetical protein
MMNTRHNCSVIFINQKQLMKPAFLQCRLDEAEALL